MAERLKLRRTFSTAVHEEVEGWLANPEIDDPTIRDLTHLPFVTIDNEDALDLDQAMALCPASDNAPSETRLYYALADASHFVRPGSALFEEASKRGVTFYFPGFNIPMLPRALSEHLCSLRQGETRRAFVIECRLRSDGECLETKLYRARIRSRAKLSYASVQAYLDGESSRFASEPFAETLALLKHVGLARMKRSQLRDVVRYDRIESAIETNDGVPTIRRRERYEVETYNEHVSLLANIQGALFLQEQLNAVSGLLGIFRVHQPPGASRLAELSKEIAETVQERPDASQWVWDPKSESLADYMARLPDSRLAQAIQRQALLANQASYFSVEPGPHHGIGASSYARFSSPMREMVGVLTHLLALDQIHEGTSVTRAAAEDAVRLANESKTLQKTIAKQATKIAMDHLFLNDLKRPTQERPKRSGTVMGVGTRIHVQLDDPPVQLKVYDSSYPARIGEGVSAQVSSYHSEKQRWMFELSPLK